MTPIEYLMLQPSRVPRQFSFARQPSAAELSWRFAAVRAARREALQRDDLTCDIQYRLLLAEGFFFNLCFAQGVAFETIEALQRRLATRDSEPELRQSVGRLAVSPMAVHFRQLGIAFDQPPLQTSAK